MLTRAAFLRGGAVAGAAALLPATAARAGLPTPTPAADDTAFLQFAAVAERASLAFYRRAGMRPAARRKAQHVQALTRALGADAPAQDDYLVTLPARAFKSRAATLALGSEIESLLVGVLLTGVTSTTDGATRLLLGRLLANDSQHLAALRHAAGAAPVQGLPVPLDLEVAGQRLDTLLTANGYPTT